MDIDAITFKDTRRVPLTLHELPMPCKHAFGGIAAEHNTCVLWSNARYYSDKYGENCENMIFSSKVITGIGSYCIGRFATSSRGKIDLTYLQF